VVETGKVGELWEEGGTPERRERAGGAVEDVGRRGSVPSSDTKG